MRASPPMTVVDPSLSPRGGGAAAAVATDLSIGDRYRLLMTAFVASRPWLLSLYRLWKYFHGLLTNTSELSRICARAAAAAQQRDAAARGAERASTDDDDGSGMMGGGGEKVPLRSSGASASSAGTGGGDGSTGAEGGGAGARGRDPQLLISCDTISEIGTVLQWMFLEALAANGAVGVGGDDEGGGDHDDLDLAAAAGEAMQSMQASSASPATYLPTNLDDLTIQARANGRSSIAAGNGGGAAAIEGGAAVVVEEEGGEREKESIFRRASSRLRRSVSRKSMSIKRAPRRRSSERGVCENQDYVYFVRGPGTREWREAMVMIQCIFSEPAAASNISLLYSNQLTLERRSLESKDCSLEEVTQLILLKKRFPRNGALETPEAQILLAALNVIHESHRVMNEINARVATKYDITNKTHERKLMELWNLLVPDEQLDGRLSEKWTKIGFQGKDPATDFRGMGMQALDDLVYFAKAHPSDAQRVLAASHHPVSWYSYAIVGINITYFVVQLMRTRRLQYYMFLYGPSRETLHEFYCYVFNAFNEHWINYSGQPPLTIMDFEREFAKVKVRVEQDLVLHKRGMRLPRGEQ